MVDPYAAIADFYDAEFEGATADAALFARIAAPGPLLVAGCGTGRVSSLLAADRRVTGLDRSEGMLARARARRDGVTYVQADLRDFTLGTFGEVLLPNAALCFLHGRADPLACLSACARSLAPGGALTLDLPAPDFGLYGVRHSPERVAWEGLVGGRTGRRTREVTRQAIFGRVDLLDRYWLDGEYVGSSLLALQLATPREIEWLCEVAGFWVDAMYGDYAGSPLRDGCPRIIVRAFRC